MVFKEPQERNQVIEGRIKILPLAGDLSDVGPRFALTGRSLDHLFFKTLDPRVHALYGGPHSKYSPSGTLGENVDDFVHLQRMHELLPQNVVAPLAIVSVGNALNVVGFLTEYVKGRDLSGHLRSAQRAKRNGDDRFQEYIELIENLKNLLLVLHRNGLYHGDLSGGNVRVTADKRIVMIDPLYYEDAQRGIRADRHNFSTLLTSARRLQN